MVVYMDPVVALVRLAPACSGSQALRKPLKGTLKALGEPALERNPVKGPFSGSVLGLHQAGLQVIQGPE